VELPEVVSLSRRDCLLNKKFSYRKQIARQLRTKYAKGMYSNPMTLNCGLEVTQDHSNWYHSKV